jgi:hypothetical protein
LVVLIVTSRSPKPQSPHPDVNYPVFVAKYDYRDDDVHVLSFRGGDLLYVIGMDGNWWFARSKDTGREGYIPSNYVAECLDAEE